VKQLKDIRRYVIVGIFVVAAVVTPPDAFSQLALAIPLCFLYELGIILARFAPSKPEEGTAGMTDAELEGELDRAEAEARNVK
jgi:sec-independent protein translocase protein TatC